MAHNINGIVTSFKYEGDLPNIGLLDNYHLIPLDSDNGMSSSEKPITPYEDLTPEIREVIKVLSFKGKCAYIETAYFGGIGAQVSETWENGKKIDGPLISYDGINNKMEYESVTIVEGSINQTLKNMGVQCQEGKDEFDTLGLGKFRSNRRIFEACNISP
jgi:hypothetical protein